MKSIGAASEPQPVLIGKAPSPDAAAVLELARQNYLEAIIALACLIEATHNAPQNVPGIAARVLMSVTCGGEALQQAEAINLKCAGSA
jgi:hypothetical protein